MSRNRILKNNILYNMIFRKLKLDRKILKAKFKNMKNFTRWAKN